MPPDPEAVRVAARNAIKEVAKSTVSDDQTIISSGLVDSLSVLKLILSLEKSLGVRIPASNLQPEDFDSVDVIVETVERVVR